LTTIQNILKSINGRVPVLLLLLFVTVSSFGYTNWEIRVDGRVTKDSERLAGAMVTLMKNSRIIQEIRTPENGKFIFILRPGVDYLIKVSKPGYVSKKLIFSTKNVSEDLIADGFPAFPIEVSLFEEMKGLDVSILEYPVGRIAFSEIDNDFQIDRVYAKNIHNELTVLYKELKALRKEMALLDKERETALALEKSLAKAELQEAILEEAEEKTIELTTSIELLKEKRERIRKDIHRVKYQILNVDTYTENGVEIQVKSLYKRNKVFEYRKITQPWGTSFYFKDGASITRHIFLLETDPDLLLESKVFKF